MPDVKKRTKAEVFHDKQKKRNRVTPNINATLTPKQRAFVQHLAMGENVPTACLRAGYEVAVYGYELIRAVHIKRAWEEEKKKYEEASQMTRAKVMQQFAEAYDMAKLIADPHAMVNATKEAAKMLGYYEPVKRRVEITVSGNGRSRELAVMSNEELAKLVDEGTSPEFNHDLRDVIEDAVIHDEETSDQDD